MQTEGISERAAAPITKAGGEGTKSNYESAWAKFSSWCNSRQTDPVRYPLNFILDYLTSLFDAQFEYRSINNHRAAISAFHCTIEGFKPGQHPIELQPYLKVCPRTSTKTKDTAVWDVEQVLRQLKKFPDYEEMTPKQVTLKVTMLLALTSLTR